jgi:hypothetical protein
MKIFACAQVNDSAHARFPELFVCRYRQIVCGFSQMALCRNFLSLSGVVAKHYLGKGKKFRRNYIMALACVLENSPLLRPSIHGYLTDLHNTGEKGRPSPGPVERLPLVGFCLPNEKEYGMSQHAPAKFLLSG